MNRLNQALLSCLLATTTLLALRMMQLVAAAQESLSLAGTRVSISAAHLDDTLQNAEALLASLRTTAEAVRRSSTSQLGYYEAIGRRSSLVLGETAVLIRHADSSVQQLARTTDDLLTQSQASVSQAGASIEATTLAATEALQAAAELSDTARARMQEAGVSTTISNLAVASEHLANSAAASEETIESIRAIVSPQRKGFWRRLMEAFIPRPTQATPQPTASR